MHPEPDTKELLKALMEWDRPAHMGRLMRGLIHNINGPLQNISMLLELMERNHSKMEDLLNRLPGEDASHLTRLFDSQKGRTEKLLGQVQIFSEMLRDFMVVQEIEANESEIDVNLILEKLGRVYQADLFLKHHVQLTLDPAPRLPLLRIRGRHLIPALHHVLQNALTALRTAPVKEIRISSHVEGDQVLIRLEDTGCGLDPRVPPEGLFEPLVTRWPPEVVEREGDRRHVGLGLFMARELLVPYGASIGLEALETGTRVVLNLPVSGTFCRTKG